MPANSGRVQHVSDTALMVAACRAMETARPDGLVRDPFAARLAGERGMAIARELPDGCELMCFGVGIRGQFLDQLLVSAVAERGVETVICFGAGLNTRAWRLDLPAQLRWIEVDFAAMLDYKAGLMRSERPRYRPECCPADLNDPAQRAAGFAVAGPGTGLMITEGLLMYLSSGAVEALV